MVRNLLNKLFEQVASTAIPSSLKSLLKVCPILELYFELIDLSSILTSLLEQFALADEIVKYCESNGKGYITARAAKDSTTNDHVYDEFIPFKPIGLPVEITLLEYDSV